MANEYKSYYLKDLIQIINQAAVSIMMQPQKLFLGEQAQKVENLAHLNDRIAHYNDGVRSLAVYLAMALEKDGGSDE
jgi:hypothetical protein